MDIKENWKNVEGYDDLYQVSDLGRIKSLRRNIIMKPSVDGDGYLQIILTNKSKQRKRFFIHRLVYIVFNGEIPSGYEINHKDENKKNNNISNLELLTKKGNINYGTRTERMAISRGMAVLQIDKKTYEIINEFYSENKAAKETGIFQTSISACCRGERKTAGGYIWKIK